MSYHDYQQLLYVHVPLYLRFHENTSLKTLKYFYKLKRTYVFFTICDKFEAIGFKKKTIFLKFEEFKNKLGSIVLERFLLIYNLAKYEDGLKKSGLTVLFFF